MPPSRPKLTVVIGASGAGKSYIREVIFPELFPEDFFDVDLVTRGLGKTGTDETGRERNRAYKRARTTVDKYIKENIRKRVSFGMETTFINSERIRMIENIISEENYEGFAVVVHTEEKKSPNKDRVLQRERQGGHPIPERVIDHDYPRIIPNVIARYGLFKEMAFIDTTANAVVIAEKKNEEIIIHVNAEDMPKWFGPILQIAGQIEQKEEKSDKERSDTP